jgi:hypothetical protein
MFEDKIKVSIIILLSWIILLVLCGIFIIPYEQRIPLISDVFYIPILSACFIYMKADVNDPNGLTFFISVALSTLSFLSSYYSYSLYISVQFPNVGIPTIIHPSPSLIRNITTNAITDDDLLLFYIVRIYTIFIVMIVEVFNIISSIFTFIHNGSMEEMIKFEKNQDKNYMSCFCWKCHRCERCINCLCLDFNFSIHLVFIRTIILSSFFINIVLVQSLVIFYSHYIGIPIGEYYESSQSLFIIGLFQWSSIIINDKEQNGTAVATLTLFVGYVIMVYCFIQDMLKMGNTGYYEQFMEGMSFYNGIFEYTVLDAYYQPIFARLTILSRLSTIYLIFVNGFALLFIFSWMMKPELKTA